MAIRWRSAGAAIAATLRLAAFAATLMAEGFGNNAIAQRLRVTLSTVEKHASAIVGRWSIRPAGATR